MNNLYSKKAKVCHKDLCATVYGNDAEIVSNIVKGTVLFLGAILIVKALS